ncbi:hypothetical protein ILUMI_02676 [Ignelater luminosus]|uniref:Uncharacterized protein n=1 Tax=Ignelater luminosus TaxID=2038154 RepID=A0A8K0GKM3_IGNLU|nr:hypothetical protein ILUMI_02676 [Ignelater luminosus]
MFNLWEDNAIGVVRTTAEEEKGLALAAEDVSADGTQMIKRYEPKGLKIEARTFLEQLAKTEKEIQEIQTQTKNQRESGIWYLERRSRLIASTFGETDYWALFKQQPRGFKEKKSILSANSKETYMDPNKLPDHGTRKSTKPSLQMALQQAKDGILRIHQKGYIEQLLTKLNLKIAKGSTILLGTEWCKNKELVPFENKEICRFYHK